MNIDNLFGVTQRVLKAREELAAAEAEFERLTGQSVNGSTAKVVARVVVGTRTATTARAKVKTSQDEPTVASIVEKMLAIPGKKYLFAELVEAAGGREKKFAVKSKLNKLRAVGTVKFANGYYAAATPKSKTPGKQPKSGRPTGGRVVSAMMASEAVQPAP